MNPFLAGLITCFGMKLIKDITATPLGKKTLAEAKKIAIALYKKVIPQKVQDQISTALSVSEYAYNVGEGAFEIYRLFDALILNSQKVVFEFLIEKDTVILKVNGEVVSKMPYSEGELSFVRSGGIDLPKEEDNDFPEETEGTWQLPVEWTYSTWSYSKLIDQKELIDSLEGLLSLCFFYTLYKNFLGLELPKRVEFLVKCEAENVGTIPSFIFWKRYREALESVEEIYGSEDVYIPEFLFKNECSPSWRVLKPDLMEVVAQN